MILSASAVRSRKLSFNGSAEKKSLNITESNVKAEHVCSLKTDELMLDERNIAQRETFTDWINDWQSHAVSQFRVCILQRRI